MATPRTRSLLRAAGAAPQTLRLHAADRAFLRDLSRVQLISEHMAHQHHYNHLKGGPARSLERLERAGILVARSQRLGLYEGNTRLYQFANEGVARAYGARLPVTGAKRNELHELLTAKAYFACGRPADFRLADRLSREEVDALGQMRPDAVYSDPETGELVLVEADSGHYTQSQIRAKLNTWRARGFGRQVWAQPAQRRCAIVPISDQIAVHRF